MTHENFKNALAVAGFSDLWLEFKPTEQGFWFWQFCGKDAECFSDPCLYDCYPNEPVSPELVVRAARAKQARYEAEYSAYLDAQQDEAIVAEADWELAVEVAAEMEAERQGLLNYPDPYGGDL